MNKSDSIRFDSVGSETSQTKKKQKKERKDKRKQRTGSASLQQCGKNYFKETRVSRASLQHRKKQQNKLSFFFSTNATLDCKRSRVFMLGSDLLRQKVVCIFQKVVYICIFSIKNEKKNIVIKWLTRNYQVCAAQAVTYKLFPLLQKHWSLATKVNFLTNYIISGGSCARRQSNMYKYSYNAAMKCAA